MEPYLVVDPDLPIAAAVPDIAAALLSSQVVVVAGETGSGKTTQLPKICLLAGRRSIGHTQPRRIAARTLAERIAEATRAEPEHRLPARLPQAAPPETPRPEGHRHQRHDRHLTLRRALRRRPDRRGV